MREGGSGSLQGTIVITARCPSKSSVGVSLKQKGSWRVIDPAVVTVVIPTHNRLHLLPTTIESILGQVGVSLELVVVDDGSTDGTGPWLDQLATEDRRVKVIHHERPQLM